MAPLEILISAGEASGDMYAARLSEALQRRTGAHLFGMGGPKMRDAGVELVADASDIAVVGITEVLRKLPVVWRAWRKLESEAKRRKPALAITVDSPGFNFGLARRLKKQEGGRIVYFISPQIWAWRPRRMRWIQRRFERVLVIFPFEEEIYLKAGVKVDFVGHPLVDSVRSKMTRGEFVARFGLDAARKIVAVLPGSRRSEIERNMPIIAEACQRMRGSGAQFVLAAAPGLKKETVEEYSPAGAPWTIIEGATYEALGAADCAIVSSGTATVEAALLGTPMVVVYRVSPVTAMIARKLVNTRLFGMVNLISGTEIVPELIQEKFTSEALERELRGLLDSPEARNAQKEDLAAVRAKLGHGGSIEKAAEIIAGMLSQNRRGQLTGAV